MKNEVKIPQRIAIFLVINLIKVKGKETECYILARVMKN